MPKHLLTPAIIYGALCLLPACAQYYYQQAPSAGGNQPASIAGFALPAPTTAGVTPIPYYFRTQPGFYGGVLYGIPYSYPMPGYSLVPPGGTMYSVPMGGGGQRFLWKAPSGYYYPWCAQPYGIVPQPVTIYMQGDTSQPARPPVSTIFSDMQKCIEESRDKGKLLPGDFRHLMLRLSDLKKIEQDDRDANNGVLLPADEEDLRRQSDDLGREISYSLKD